MRKYSPAYGRRDLRLDRRTLDALKRLSEHGERRAVALTPDRAFHGGRYELPVLSDVALLWVDEDRRAIQGTIVAFDHADNNEDVRFFADLLYPRYGRRWDLDSGLSVTEEFIATFRATIPHNDPEGRHLRIPTDARQITRVYQRENIRKEKAGRTMLLGTRPAVHHPVL